MSWVCDNWTSEEWIGTDDHNFNVLVWSQWYGENAIQTLRFDSSYFYFRDGKFPACYSTWKWGYSEVTMRLEEPTSLISYIEWLDDGRTKFDSQQWAKISVFHSVLFCYENFPASIKRATVAFFPGNKAESYKLTSHLDPVTKLRKCGAMPPPSVLLHGEVLN